MRLAALAAEVTTDLRKDDPPLGLDGRESICPACWVVHWSVAVTPCRDCLA